MVWALWGIDKFLAPASSLVATLTVSWLPRSEVLNRINYYTSIVNRSHLNIVVVVFVCVCVRVCARARACVRACCSTDSSEILAVSIKEK